MTKPSWVKGPQGPIELRSEAACICGWESEDRGGGYFETVPIPDPDCPQHFPQQPAGADGGAGVDARGLSATAPVPVSPSGDGALAPGGQTSTAPEARAPSSPPEPRLVVLADEDPDGPCCGGECRTEGGGAP